MGRLTGCKTYTGIQYHGKTGKLVLSNEKLTFQEWDPEKDLPKGHKSWKWPDLTDFKAGSDGKGHRKLRITTSKNDTLGFVVEEDATLEKLKADLSNRMLGRGVTPPKSSQSPARVPEGDAESSLSSSIVAPIAAPLKVVNNMLLKPAQQIAQDYVVGPATNNAVVKGLDRIIVQPVKDEVQLATHKSAQVSKRLVRAGSTVSGSSIGTGGDASGSEDELDRSLDRSMDRSMDGSKNRGMRDTSLNRRRGKKRVDKEKFPKYLEKVQNQMNEIIKAAPEEDQREMALALACWAQNLANEPIPAATPPADSTTSGDEKKVESTDEKKVEPTTPADEKKVEPTTPADEKKVEREDPEGNE